MAGSRQRPGEKIGVPPRLEPQHDAGYVTRLAAMIAFGVSMVHWGEMPAHFAKQAYVGVLFAIGSTALLYASLALVRRPSLLSWWVGAGTMAAMFGFGIASRTSGLPGVSWAHWGPPLILSLVLELGFLALWAYEALGARNSGATSDEPAYPRESAAAARPRRSVIDTQ